MKFILPMLLNVFFKDKETKKLHDLQTSLLGLEGTGASQLMQPTLLRLMGTGSSPTDSLVGSPLTATGYSQLSQLNPQLAQLSSQSLQLPNQILPQLSQEINQFKNKKSSNFLFGYNISRYYSACC